METNDQCLRKQLSITCAPNLRLNTLLGLKLREVKLPFLVTTIYHATICDAVAVVHRSHSHTP